MTSPAHRFLDLLNNPALRGEHAIAELEKLASGFPASHVVQGLLARLLKEEGSFDYSHQLRMAAVTAPSRQALFTYLEQPAFATTRLMDEITAKETTLADTDPVIQAQEELQVVVIAAEESEEVIEARSVSHPATEEMVEEITGEPHTQLLSSLEEQPDEWDSPLLRQVVAFNVPITGKDVAEDIKTDTETGEKEAGNLDAILNDPLEREVVSDAINKSIQHEVVLDALSQDKTGDDIETPTETGFSYWLDPEKLKHNVREEKMKKIDRLIEEFIRQEPRIKPKKTEFFEPSKAARESVKLDENLASEPLARIFEKQGYFEKSIRIYEKLMLKFPEKKAYFASRIEKVQEVIKNIKK